MTDERVQEFAAASRCVVVAAAGCGKTELIARAVAASKGRQLILTHTHAGVRALRDRLRSRKADPALYSVDTISGFSLQYAASFPSLSGCCINEPTSSDWMHVYEAALRVLQHRHIRSILTHSYIGIFVDEYQDCTVKQHELIKFLAELLPTRIVGDPLQGIFDFSPVDDPLVDWPKHVYPFFKKLDDLETPYRWQYKNYALGQWLTEVRRRLLSGEPIRLDGGAPVRWVQLGDAARHQAAQIQVCRNLPHNAGDSIAVIRKWPSKAHAIAKMMNGQFRSMEEVECKDLLECCETLDATSGVDRARVVLDFALKCMTKKPDCLRELAKLLNEGKYPGDRKLKGHESLKDAVRAVADSGEASSIGTMLQLIDKMPGVTLHRKELYREMQRVMRNHNQSPEASMRSTAWKTRDRARRFGRPTEKRVVSRTPLIKGLEFDHAVIVDADDFDDAKNLYVALTRGAKSLTVMSASSIIQRPIPGLALQVPNYAPIRQLSLSL